MSIASAWRSRSICGRTYTGSPAITAAISSRQADTTTRRKRRRHRKSPLDNRGTDVLPTNASSPARGRRVCHVSVRYQAAKTGRGVHRFHDDWRLPLSTPLCSDSYCHVICPHDPEDPPLSDV